MEKSKLKQRIVAVAKFIGIVSLVIIVGIVAVDPVIKIVFGSKYDNSIVPAQLLLFAII